MRIYTDIFRQYENIFKAACKRGDRIGESLYFDLENRFVYSKTDRFACKLNVSSSFLFKKDEQRENFWVNTSDFFKLGNNYEILELEGVIFYNPQNREECFEIATFQEDFEGNCFVHKNENWKSHTLSEKTLQYLREAYPFTSSELLSDYRGVYLNNHRLVATERTKMYCVQIEEGFEDFYLHRDLIEVALLTKNQYRNVILYYDQNKKNKVVLSLNDGEFEIFCAEKLKFELPPIDDPEFKERYDHKDYIVFNRKGFLNILEFIDSLIRDLTNKQICISIKEKGVFIQPVKDKTINKKLPVDYFSQELIRKHVYVSLDYIQLALGSFNEEKLKLQMNPEKIILNFTSAENNGDRKHTIISRLEE